MSHVRTQIRDVVRAVLIAALPDHKVYGGRRYSVNASELPCVDMKFLNENIEVVSMGSTIDRTASLYIRATRSASEGGIDDALDADAVIIEHAMADPSNPLGGLAVDFELMQTNFTDGADGDKPVAEVIIRYDILYRTDRRNVEQAEG